MSEALVCSRHQAYTDEKVGSENKKRRQGKPLPSFSFCTFQSNPLAFFFNPRFNLFAQIIFETNMFDGFQ